MKMKKLAFIGNGRVAAHYKEIFSTYFDKSEYLVTHLVDTDTNKHQDEFFSTCSKFLNIHEFLQSGDLNIDYALVCTPSGTHYDITKQLLLANIIPIVEKPPTLTLDQLQDLKNVEASTGNKSVYIFQNRFNPAIVEAKRLLETKRLGELVTVSVVLRWCRFDDYYQDDWHGTWQNDGGVAAQQGIHHLDALQHLVGGIQKVVGFSGTLVNKLEAEDTITACLQTECGALGTIELTTGCRPRDLEASLSITGTLGRLKIGGIALNKLETLEIVDESKNLSRIYTSKFCENVKSGYGVSHYRQLKKVFSDNAKRPFALEEIENTMLLLHALLSSTELNKPVEILDRIQHSKLGK